MHQFCSLSNSDSALFAHKEENTLNIINTTPPCFVAPRSNFFKRDWCLVNAVWVLSSVRSFGTGNFPVSILKSKPHDRPNSYSNVFSDNFLCPILVESKPRADLTQPDRNFLEFNPQSLIHGCLGNLDDSFGSKQSCNTVFASSLFDRYKSFSKTSSSNFGRERQKNEIVATSFPKNLHNNYNKTPKGQPFGIPNWHLLPLLWFTNTLTCFYHFPGALFSNSKCLNKLTFFLSVLQRLEF